MFHFAVPPSQQQQQQNKKNIVEPFMQNLHPNAFGIFDLFASFKSWKKYDLNSFLDLILIKYPPNLRKYIRNTQLTFVKS